MAEDQPTEWVVQERGHFWWADEIPPGHPFPSIPASAVTGELRITREGRIRLHLDGVLAGQDPFLPVNTSDEFDAVRARSIRGVLREGNGVVLFALTQAGTLVSATQCLISDQPFAGEIEKPALSHIDADLKGFEEWLREPGLKSTHGELVSTLEYRKREPVIYSLQRGQLSLERSLHRTSHVGEIAWREAARFRFQPDEVVGVEAAAEWHRWLQDLMILLTDSDYRLEWPMVRWGEYYCTLYFTWLSSQAERPHLHECPTNFPQVRENFGDLFGKWLTIRESYGPGIYHYLGTRRGMELYTESEFTLLVSGLEGFHRAKHGKGQLENVVKKVDRIISQIARKKDRDWTESQLSYSTFPNLEDRLVELVEGLALGFDKARVRSFAKACANTRNWLSHGDIDPTMTYTEFSLSVHKKNNALRSLYHALVLAEMGLDPAMVRAWAIEKPPAFRRKWDFAEVGLMDHIDPSTNTSA